jgi:hypothetical protein
MIISPWNAGLTVSKMIASTIFQGQLQGVAKGDVFSQMTWVAKQFGVVA